ncbi:Leucine-rich repeat-containing protein [Artemisia annua]|uniref:Leucine-rich repeat-containing protein n=1 Tax=Artemisia annua TaxID=35608 RepID=A0A2U1QKJ3_ARTAN|nr:Leucine-rich repeat-containing protein [Artemisia annua]
MWCMVVVGFWPEMCRKWLWVARLQEEEERVKTLDKVGVLAMVLVKKECFLVDCDGELILVYVYGENDEYEGVEGGALMVKIEQIALYYAIQAFVGQ